MKRSRYTSRTAGFTLIEMIVATILLTIGIVGALGAIHTAAQTTILADGAQTAALLAQKQIAQLELQPSQLTGGDQSGDFGNDYPGYHWQQSVESTDYTTLFKVTLTVSWGQKNNTCKRDFITYLTTGENFQQQNVTTTTSTGTTGTGTTGAGGK